MHHLREFVLLYLPYILSAIGVFMILKAGDMRRYAWIIGIAAQVLWFIWIMTSENYGFLFQNVALVIVYARNYYKWRHVEEARS